MTAHVHSVTKSQRLINSFNSNDELFKEARLLHMLPHVVTKGSNSSAETSAIYSGSSGSSLAGPLKIQILRTLKFAPMLSVHLSKSFSTSDVLARSCKRISLLKAKAVVLIAFCLNEPWVLGSWMDTSDVM